MAIKNETTIGLINKDTLFPGIEKCNVFALNEHTVKCEATDMAVLLGCKINSNENPCACYWTEDPSSMSEVSCADFDGKQKWISRTDRTVSVRPTVSFDSIDNIDADITTNESGIKIASFGEYPQMVAASDVSHVLERKLYNDVLKTTGKIYTTDSAKVFEREKSFQPKAHIEYVFENKRYVRVIANTCNGSNESFSLSNGNVYKNGDYVWIEVSPINWFVDDSTNMLISIKSIASGVRYGAVLKENTGFEESEMYRFLNEYLHADIFTPKPDVDNKNAVRKIGNPYNLKFDLVTEEDIIKASIESDIPVFLHGQSSEGKSSRVKQLDPDCKIIYLRNATPESFNGKSVYNAQTGEMIDIPPTWYKEICENCEKEPGKLHIIFLDEITNALDAIQGMAFNVVLDRKVNDLWQLPKNCRVVAAGNDEEDSRIANKLAEPLFNRFAHVYIKTSVKDWLKWATTDENEYHRLDVCERREEQKIHPAIFGFIAYKGEDAIRTRYNGETPNADPRKWEMASRMLYSTKNPEMLRSLIGEEMTKEFSYFCSQQVITLSDVISGRYKDEELDMNTSEKYATVIGLSYAEEEDFNTVRKFVRKMEPEFVALFDTLWIRGCDNRKSRVLEERISMNSKLSIVKANY